MIIDTERGLNDRYKILGIVYCLSRKDSEQVCLDLRGKGISTGCYHADLPAAERSQVHRQWLKKMIQVHVNIELVRLLDYMYIHTICVDPTTR